jgi:hypothetical protein
VSEEEAEGAWRSTRRRRVGGVVTAARRKSLGGYACRRPHLLNSTSTDWVSPDREGPAQARGRSREGSSDQTHSAARQTWSSSSAPLLRVEDVSPRGSLDLQAPPVLLAGGGGRAAALDLLAGLCSPSTRWGAGRRRARGEEGGSRGGALARAEKERRRWRGPQTVAQGKGERIPVGGERGENEDEVEGIVGAPIVRFFLPHFADGIWDMVIVGDRISPHALAHGDTLTRDLIL